MGILCSICKDSSHLAKNCPCGWISPPEAPPSSQPAEPDLQPTQPASPQNSSLQSSQSSQYSSSSQSSSSPASVSPSSPSFSPIAETLHGDDSDDANMENVPVPPLAINPMTASDDEMYHGVISDVNLLNSSAQSTDVDIDQELYNLKRSAEASNSEYITVTRKKKTLTTLPMHIDFKIISLNTKRFTQS